MALFEMESVLVVIVLRQNGSPLPEFETNEAHDYFIARLFVRESFYDHKDGNVSGTTKETTKETAPTSHGTIKETSKETVSLPQDTSKDTIKENLLSAIRHPPI